MKVSEGLGVASEPYTGMRCTVGEHKTDWMHLRALRILCSASSSSKPCSDIRYAATIVAERAVNKGEAQCGGRCGSSMRGGDKHIPA